MISTRVTRHTRAPRDKVYGAFIDAKAVATWMVPTGMLGWNMSLGKLAVLVEKP
jgi:hypothetical protein